MKQVFLSPLYLISFFFSSQCHCTYTLSKAKNIRLHNFYYLSKKYEMNFLKMVLLKCFEYLNIF